MNKHWYCALAGLAMCGGYSAVAQGRDCTTIGSALERLNCFDQAAGTPVSSGAVRPRSTPQTLPASYGPLQANEHQRPAGYWGFVISTQTEDPSTGQQSVMISAPSLSALGARRYLAISCESNISRLQLLLEQPVARPSVMVQLRMDDHAVAASRPWRVLEGGFVIDAGRGLPAVELIKRLGKGKRISIGSDEPSLDGLLFEAQDLAPMIEEERKACHW